MNLSHLMRQRVVVAGPGSVNSHGDPVHKARRVIRARVERNAKRVRRTDGTEYVSTAQIYTYDPIAEGERCWLPGTDSTQAEQSHEVLVAMASEDIADGRTLYEAEV